MKHDLNMVNLLVSAKANPNSEYGFEAGSLRMPWRATALYAAVPHGNLSIVTELIRLKADPHSISSNNANLVWNACYHHQYEILIHLLNLGVDPELPAQSQDIKGVSSTPLHAAAQTGSKKMVKALINAGVDTNIENEEGASPVDLAVLYVHPHVVRTLVSAQANLVQARRSTFCRKPLFRFQRASSTVSQLFKGHSHEKMDISTNSSE